MVKRTNKVNDVNNIYSHKLSISSFHSCSHDNVWWVSCILAMLSLDNKIRITDRRWKVLTRILTRNDSAISTDSSHSNVEMKVVIDVMKVSSWNTIVRLFCKQHIATDNHSNNRSESMTLYPHDIEIFACIWIFVYWCDLLIFTLQLVK